MAPQAHAEYDVVCLGSGAAGLTAAIAAHELGLSVLVVEKSSKIGGVAAISGGQAWIPANHLAEEAGIEDSVENAVAYLMWIGGGLGDEARARHYCTYARQAVRFLADHAGLAWQIVPVADDYHGHPEARHSLGPGRLLEVELFPGSSLGAAQSFTRHGPERITASEVYTVAPPEAEIEARRERDERGHGGSLLGSLVKNVLERGIDVWRDAPATELLVADGRVSGVRATHEGSVVEVAARRGVVVATGGYDSSAADRASFDADHAVSTSSLPSVTGDHFRLAGRLGARVAAPFRLPHNFHLPGVPVIRDADGVVQRDASIVRSAAMHAVVVNRRGRRFADETTSASRDAGLFAVDVHEPWKFANNPCWAVWDAQHVARYLDPEAMQTPGIVSAQSLKELAVAAGIDPDGLEEEIARFNANVALGTDPDFGRGSPNAGHIHGGDRSGAEESTLGTIEQPPFHAVRLVQTTMGLPHAGLVTDGFGRVLDWDDVPIEGLYAAGGSVAFLEFGLNYTPGNANARSLLQGFCAGSHLGSSAGHP
ncbi:MAG: FAD-dependent oxidoreductase [Acidimicrobiaceae bacterium]|nr:FAD-dependent oxidoreductase [Acidimicrobiaceae bacterium]